MGPFVPDIITNEMNLVVAFLLGIAFGAVLEQAGFSSSRRLADGRPMWESPASRRGEMGGETQATE